MLELRKFEHKDCAHLVQWVPDAQFLLQWAGPRYTFPLTTAQIEATYRKTLRKDADHLMFKAIRGTDQETVGHVELMHIDPAKKSAHIGRVLIYRPEQRGKGYGSRMIRLLLDIAFNAMGMRELTLAVFDYNRQAVACYTKIGFRLYDYQENMRYLDRHWNLISMKLTRECWISQMDTS